MKSPVKGSRTVANGYLELPYLLYQVLQDDCRRHADYDIDRSPGPEEIYSAGGAGTRAANTALMILGVATLSLMCGAAVIIRPLSDMSITPSLLAALGLHVLLGQLDRLHYRPL